MFLGYEALPSSFMTCQPCSVFAVTMSPTLAFEQALSKSGTMVPDLNHPRSPPLCLLAHCEIDLATSPKSPPVCSCSLQAFAISSDATRMCRARNMLGEASPAAEAAIRSDGLQIRCVLPAAALPSPNIWGRNAITPPSLAPNCLPVPPSSGVEPPLPAACTRPTTPCTPSRVSGTECAHESVSLHAAGPASAEIASGCSRG
mmetsp:Transcript_10737/g.32872  ORF Transcript_10737/g.32872 Transcript_10737/m.32872 type:complete len:202 (+) Transcript_10737:597-1202(+)